MKVLAATVSLVACASLGIVGCTAADNDAHTARSDSSRDASKKCEPSGEIQYICGPVNAEDILQIGDTEWLVTSGMSGFQGPPTVGALYLVNHVARTSEKWFPGQNPILKADRKMFADCPGPPDASTFVAHGLDLQQQDTNRYRLYVTSHGKRESVEVFDIETAQSPPTIAWVGCVQLPKTAPANGVAILPDGGFMVTNTLDPGTSNGFAEMLTGKITGRVYEWHPGREVVAVEGTDLSGPNGIAISADGRTLYVTASGSRQVIRYELESRPLRKESSVPLAILPDDLHWTKTGTLYTAGRNYVPPTQCAGASCETGWSILEINANTLEARRITGADLTAALQGASGAIAVGDSIWIGTYAGDRIAYVSLH